MTWEQSAACRGEDTNLFYDPREEHTAKAVCVPCPVREQCLQHALSNEELFGVWGGKTENERRKIRKQHVNRPRGPELWRDCGTEKAYTRHRKHGSVPCQPCTDAANAAGAERKAS